MIEGLSSRQNIEIFFREKYTLRLAKCLACVRKVQEKYGVDASEHTGDLSFQELLRLEYLSNPDIEPEKKDFELVEPIVESTIAKYNLYPKPFSEILLLGFLALNDGLSKMKQDAQLVEGIVNNLEVDRGE